MRTEERQQIDITFITIGLIRMREDILIRFLITNANVSVSFKHLALTRSIKPSIEKKWIWLATNHEYVYTWMYILSIFLFEFLIC